MLKRAFILCVAGCVATAHAQPVVVTSVSGGGFSASRGSGTSPMAATASPGLAAAGAAPVITQPPADKTVAVGAAATFTVAATGNDPLTYQWYKRGIAVSGATQTFYTIAAASSADDGAQVTVAVTDVFCQMTTSTPAILHVTGGGSANACDINADGSVDVADVQRLVNAALGNQCKVGP